jgi:hypothetical protein
VSASVIEWRHDPRTEFVSDRFPERNDGAGAPGISPRLTETLAWLNAAFDDHPEAPVAKSTDTSDVNRS